MCPTSVVELIRSWKADICTRKVNVTFAPFEEALDTAELLFTFSDMIKDDFIVIVGSVIFDSEILIRSVAEHRAKEPVLTMIMQESSDQNTPPVNLKKSMTEVNTPTNFVGYHENKLLYIKSRTSMVASLESSKVTIKKTLLRKFPEMKISSSLFDSQVSSPVCRICSSLRSFLRPFRFTYSEETRFKS